MSEQRDEFEAKSISLTKKTSWKNSNYWELNVNIHGQEFRLVEITNGGLLTLWEPATKDVKP